VDDTTDLAELLARAGRAHHEAFAESDGVDPEWAAWYAGYLQAPLRERTGRWVSRSELTYLLVRAAREHGQGVGPWPGAYARLIAAELATLGDDQGRAT
jgi:NAD(P)H-hydrate epimerase